MLRDYQVQAIDRVRTELKSGHKSVLVVAPTGAGKTVIGATIATRSVANGRKCLWVVHRIELVDQSISVLEKHGLKVGAVSAGARARPNPFASMQVASVGTLLSRDIRPDADIVFVDEAHWSSADEYLRLLEHYKDKIIIGLTATPERSDGRGLNPPYSSMVVVASYKQLIDGGHLVPSEIIRPPRMLDSAHIAQPPVSAYQQHAAGSKAIVFARTIELAESYAKDFNLAGFAAKCVSAESSWGDRCAALDAFKRGTVRVLTNVYALTEGVDVPDVETIILARGFGTMGPYLQTCGRGMRPAPGKTRCLIIDLRGVTWELGKPEDDHLYSLDGRGIRNADPNTYCPSCGSLREVGENCTNCEWKVSAEPTKDDTITNDPLVKYHYVRQDDEDQRVARLARWMKQAEVKGYAPGWFKHRFKVVYDQWPTFEQLKKAKEAA